MAVTKTPNYYKNKTLLKLGSRVKNKYNQLGTIVNLSDYKNPRYDYRVASVRYDNGGSAVYSIGSLYVLDAHKRELFEQLTNEPCIYNLEDLAIDYVVRFRDVKIFDVNCGEILRRYYLDEESISSIGEVMNLGENTIKGVLDAVLSVARDDYKYLNSLLSLEINYDAPLGCILSKSATTFLRERSILTLADLNAISRPDLFHCGERLKSEIKDVYNKLKEGNLKS